MIFLILSLLVAVGTTVAFITPPTLAGFAYGTRDPAESNRERALHLVPAVAGVVIPTVVVWISPMPWMAACCPILLFFIGYARSTEPWQSF